jgi:dolichol-phosphate mannosyltransferase
VQATASDKEPLVTDAAERILVSVATYNESDNLVPLVRAIHEMLPRADVLIIDDNSPDGTGGLADEMAARDRRIRVVHRAGKLGLGTAIVAAMRFAIKNGYDQLVNMDADFSHHPRYLPALLGGMAGRDVMIGSRYVPGGGTVNWPLSRRLTSWGVNALARLLLRIPAHDTSGAYRCYRVSLLRRADFDALWSHGYSFQEEILYRLCLLGARLGETPIVFEDRRAGISKVNLREAVRSLSILVVLGVRSLLGRDRG